MPSASSAPQAGPVMKSCSPVITSVGIVRLGSSGRMSKRSKISFSQSRVASTQSESPSSEATCRCSRSP